MILYFSTYILFPIVFVRAYTDDLIDITFGQRDSTFLISDNQSLKYNSSTFFASASNLDRYEIDASIGFLHSSLTVLGDKLIKNSKFHVTVHSFDMEISEETKTLHFLCHAVYYGKVSELSFESSSMCCIISINASYFNELTSCVLVIDRVSENWICHASIQLPQALWKQNQSPEVTLAYASSGFISNPDNVKQQHDNHDNFKRCHLSLNHVKLSFVSIPSVNIAHTVPDAIRELGRSLLLQIPRRELKTNEEFLVTVRLKRFDDVSDFTLRCEIPSNTYVEFVRVIWPAGVNSIISPSSSPSLSSPVSLSSTTNGDTSSSVEVEEFFDTQTGSTSRSSERNDIRSHNMWDVFHRSVISSKRNVTEIVARFREDLVTSNPSSKYSSATEAYKLQFRVNKPQSNSPGRVAPRIFWSLVSLSRRNSPDHSISASPVVTRLNIEPSEFKHITMVLKTSALVNLAVLTGQPTIYPVWVYGLTHDLKLIDITNKATCHTGDDAVIHFAQDICSKLGFSGAELDGSPGLPLVAKMDGRSASATLLVWYPKSPSLKLIVESSSTNSYDSMNQDSSNHITIKRLATEIVAAHSNFHKSPWTNQINSTEAPQFFQYFRIRIMARFILASSVLHDKDVLGGRINQYVDVTEFTIHRLRIEYIHENLINNNNLLKNSNENYLININQSINNHYQLPIRLIKIGNHYNQKLTNQLSSKLSSSLSSFSSNQFIKPLRVWIIGQYIGNVKLYLSPINRNLLNTFIPPGLIKQLKDHTSIQLHNDNQSLLLKNDEQFKEPSITVHVTDETSIWPVGLSAQLVTDFSISVSHSSGMDDTHQRTSSTLSSSNSNNNNNIDNNNNNDNLFLSSSTERMPILSGVYSLKVELKGSKLTHSGSINSEFNQPNITTHRKMSILSNNNNNDNYHFNNKTNQLNAITMGNPIGFLIVWIHLSDGSSILWNRMTEIYERLYGKNKIPMSLSIKNCRPDLFWIETSSPGLVETKQRSVRGVSPTSTIFSSESPQILSKSSFIRQNNNRFLGLSRRSVRMKPHLLRIGDHSTSRNQQTYSNMLRNGIVKNITLINASNYWSGPIVWLFQRKIKFSGDILEVGLTSPSGNLLVPHVRIRGEIITPKNSLSMNEYLESNDHYELNSKTIQESKTNQGNIHGSMAFKDAPGFQKLDYYHPMYSSSSSSSALSSSSSDKISNSQNPQLSNTVSINSDDINVDDRLSILSDVGGGNTNHVENKELMQDSKNKPSMNRRSGSRNSNSGYNGINGNNDRANDAKTSSRPALEMSMYILLGLFAVVGLVFAVNCGVVVVRYRWEKMNMDNTDGIDTATRNGSCSIASGCVRGKYNKSLNDDNNHSQSLTFTDPVSNNNEVTDHKQLISAISTSPKYNWKNHPKSDADNHDKLLPTNINSHNNNKERKRTKRSASSVFGSRQKHKPLLHRDSSWVWVGRQHVISEQNETDKLDENSNPHHHHHSQLIGYNSELTNFNITAPTSTTTNIINNGSSIGVPKIDASLSHSHKRPVQFNGMKKNSTTAVLSVGEADLLLLQSPYRESVWQDTLRSDTIESDSRFLYVTSDNLTQQFGYAEEIQPNSFLYNRLSIPASNAPKNECQTLGRHLKRHTTAFTQRNYQGQECSIRIISNPMSSKKQHHHAQQELTQQFLNPQLFLSDYSPENMKYINQQSNNNNNTLTNSVIVSESWLNNSNPLMMLNGNASASLHRKQISPVYLHDERTTTVLCSDLLNHNDITLSTMNKSKNITTIKNSPVISSPTIRHQSTCQMLSPLPMCLSQVCNDESSLTTSSQHQHYQSNVNQDWMISGYRKQPLLNTDDIHHKDFLEHNNSNNQSTIDRQDCTTIEMLNVSSPICPLNSPWQIRKTLEKSLKRNQSDCCSTNQQCELHSPLIDRTNIHENHLQLNEVLELNETSSFSQSPPNPPIRTTSRGTITYHTLGHLTRHNNNNNNTNNQHPRPLSLPQSFHVTNELYSALCQTDSSKECVKLLAENIYKKHKTKQNNIDTINKNNNNTSEICQDCFFSSSYDILSKYLNKQQSPSEESLWWYHPVHQKRRRKRKHQSKTQVEDNKSNHHHHQHHHHFQHHHYHHQNHCDQSITKHHQQLDNYISNISEQSRDLSIPMITKYDTTEVNDNGPTNSTLYSDKGIDSQQNLCESIEHNDLKPNTVVINDHEKLSSSSSSASSSTSSTAIIPLQQQQQYHSIKSHHKNMNKYPFMNSQSDLSWEQELLCLSHDRLVAYFAEMKESNA
ncbi:unnamed protein product [Schistosoma haematobium]|nr:unnamed protein product [Schistosoma haematobium]